MNKIKFEDWEKLDLRSGRILEVKDHPKKDHPKTQNFYFWRNF